MDGLGIICVDIDDGIFAGRRCSVEESDSTILSQLPSILSAAACTDDFR